MELFKCRIERLPGGSISGKRHLGLFKILLRKPQSFGIDYQNGNLSRQGWVSDSRF